VAGYSRPSKSPPPGRNSHHSSIRIKRRNGGPIAFSSDYFFPQRIVAVAQRLRLRRRHVGRGVSRQSRFLAIAARRPGRAPAIPLDALRPLAGGCSAGLYARRPLAAAPARMRRGQTPALRPSRSKSSRAGRHAFARESMFSTVRAPAAMLSLAKACSRRFARRPGAGRSSRERPLPATFPTAARQHPCTPRRAPASPLSPRAQPRGLAVAVARRPAASLTTGSRHVAPWQAPRTGRTGPTVCTLGVLPGTGPPRRPSPMGTARGRATAGSPCQGAVAGRA